ncbi:proline--tRNA ligase [Candidatus Woesearchaeota archaeon]|nr:proline--tRNA ligase [Candidatus Woesearchaeota archaeon]
MGLTVKKSENFSEWYTQAIQKAELIEYGSVSGCMILRPYSYAIWENIQSYLDAKFKKTGVKNAYFPLLIPEKLFQLEKEHVQGFNPEVAWVTASGDSQLTERLAIRPTSETIMYDSYKKWIRSYKDLPLKINQWVNIIRWEFKNPVPFLRTREFLWQEGHNVLATKEEMDKDVRTYLEIYKKAYENLLAVPIIEGRKSEREKFAGADYTLSVETLFPNGKAVQGATSHALGQNFARSFGISFLDKKQKKQYPWQDSWGFSTRSIGIALGVHGDDKGLVIPPRVAPHQIVIVPIYFSKQPGYNEKIRKLAKEVEDGLVKMGIRVESDLHDDNSPGFKFNKWEIRGVPIRMEIGPKDVDENKVVLVRRDNGEKIEVKTGEVNAVVLETLNKIHDNLFNRAKLYLQAAQKKVDSIEVLKDIVGKGQIGFGAWCGNQDCEENIKDQTGGTKSLNIPFDQPNLAEGQKCSFCERKAQYWAYFSKSY